MELGKFNLRPEEVKTDLDKLLYTMKTTEKTSVLEPFNPPEFWDEEWMKAAVEELNLRGMTPQERFAYEKALIKYRMAAQYTEELEQEKAKAQEEAAKAQQDAAKAQEGAVKAQEEANKAKEKAARAQQETTRAQKEATRAQQEAARVQQEKAEAQRVLKQQEEETRRAIIKMLSSGLLSDEQIAEFQNIPLSQVQEIKRTL